MTENEQTTLPRDITTLEQEGRTIHIVGTAHVSQESVQAVRDAVEGMAPDCVCVELDSDRLESLRNPTQWDKLNLGAALRKGKGPFLLANLALSAFQRRLGLHTGVKPGAELAEAVKVAEEKEICVELVDRNIRTTLLRAWRITGVWKKIMMIASLLASVFDATEIDEEELRELRSRDTLSVLLEEMGKVLPTVKQILIDERDRYMAGMIQRADGQNIVAVVGAGHVPGITRILREEWVKDDEIEALDVIPEKGLFSRVIPWAIPGIIIAVFIAGFFWSDPQALKEAALAWVLANGVLSAIGAVLAFGHPLTIATAFVAAPITSLNPTIGAGMVTGVVQAWAGKPRVRDAEEIWNDLSHWKGWWANRVSRVFLVFLFSSLGSFAGTWIGAYWMADALK